MVYVNSVTVAPKTLNLKIGRTFTASAKVSPLNATKNTVHWSSKNDSIASVTSDGFITAKKVGTTIIYATAIDESRESDYLTVVVSEAQESTITSVSETSIFNDSSVELETSSSEIFVSSISICPEEITLEDGSWFECLDVTVFPNKATNTELEWYSDYPNIAEYNSTDEKIHANSPGVTRIHAVATDGSGVSDSIKVTVTPRYVQFIVFENNKLTLSKGSKGRNPATAYPLDATNTNLIWESSNPEVATVDSSTGEITAVNPGNTVITATSTDRNLVTKSFDVVVTETVTTPTEETKEYYDPRMSKDKPKKNPHSQVADPIDAFSGAHEITNTAFKLFGGLELKFIASYNSTKLVDGSLGCGWYHNYEKRISVSSSSAYVYLTPALYSKYEIEDCEKGRYTCVSANKVGYVLTVDECADDYPYVIDCNSERTEYYNEDGYLAKIVDHQDFATTITYSGSTVTITDTVSGKSMYLEKDTNGRIVRVHDGTSRQATFTYSDDFLVNICNANGDSLTFTYDCEGRVLTGTDAKNICYFENT